MNRLRQQENLFFLLMAIAMAIIVFFGFARTFYLSFWFEQGRQSSSAQFYVHGAVFTAWMLLLILQPALIKVGRTTTHRIIGWLGVVIAIGVVTMGVYAALVAAARPVGSLPPAKTAEFLCVILFGIVMFGLLVSLAIAFRNNSAFHKRFMLLATINLLQAAIVRTPIRFPVDFIPAETFVLANLFILPMVIWDLCVLKRIHPATLWGGLAIFVSLPLRFWLSETPAWLTAADWLVGLLR